jgi:hypothetical protein
MKALEILKEHKYSLDCLIRTDIVSHLLKQTNETIAELEALDNRSCESCKHYNKYILCPIFVEAVRRCGHYNKKVNEFENFCCKLWESK